ncbi:MAG: hypothetical protein SGPRY_000641, partial [Prymnesium sp.]
MDLLGNGPGGQLPFAVLETQAQFDKALTAKTATSFRKMFDDREPGKVYGIEPYGKNVACDMKDLQAGSAISPGVNMKVLMPTGEKMYLNTIKITLKPGYSFGVHVHPFGGMACVSGGQFRLFFEYPFSDEKYEGTGPEGAL